MYKITLTPKNTKEFLEAILEAHMYVEDIINQPVRNDGTNNAVFNLALSKVNVYIINAKALGYISAEAIDLAERVLIELNRMISYTAN